MGYVYDTREPSLAAGPAPMSQLGQFPLMNLSPCVDRVFLLLCVSRNLCSVPGTVSFTLLGAG